MDVQKLMQAYNAQALKTFSGRGVSNPMPWDASAFSSVAGNSFDESLTKAVDTVNAVANTDPYYSAGGFFVDCCLEAPIINTTLNPLYSLFNMIPVVPTNDRKVVFGYLTSISGTTGTYPNAPCDDDPTVGDPSYCKAEYNIGRISAQTKTLELDALIEKACMGVREDFYLVGNIRGTSAYISPNQLNDRGFVARAAVRRQMQLVGRELQRDLIKQFWTGDPTNAAVNTAGGGRREFWGLLNLIANDYGTKPFVSGTNCAALNSDIKTFPGCVGDGTNSIYNYLQVLEDTIYNRAASMGLLPVDWVLVMHPIIWSELIKYLPCEMMSDSCVRPGFNAATSGSVINLDGGMAQSFVRNQLQQTMRIPLNGREYNVVLDNGLPLVQGGTPAAPTYTGDILMIPLRVSGESVLYLRNKNYAQISQQLAPIPGGMDFSGWTDGGRFHSVVEYQRRCFLVSTKTELGLVFTAPQLAGRIQSVCVSRLQPGVVWDTNGTTVR